MSDESETGDPNRYTNVYSLVQNLRRAALTIELDAGHPINEDYIVFVDTSEDEENSVRALEWDRLVATTAQVAAATEVGVLLSAARIPDLEVEDMDSGAATDGQVPTADGTGGIAWEDQSGGGGGGSAFDLHDDVTGFIGTGVLAGDDRLVVSDESLAGDPNRYTEVDDVLERLYDLGIAEQYTTDTPEDDDLVFIGDTSRTSGTRMRAIEMSDLTGRLDVADIGSGSATDGQVPTADGSGGVAWEAGGEPFDLHDDVGNAILAGDLAPEDRFVASNEDLADDPNRYVTAGNLIDSLFDVAAAKVYSGAMAANDIVVLGDTSRSDGNRIRGILWSNYIASLLVESMDSGTADDNQVATADGSGGIVWEDQSGGGGSDFNLNDDVTTAIGEGNIAAQDRFVISDFSGANDPNRWADLDDVIQGIWPALAGRASHTATPANADIVMIGDASMSAGLRMRRMLWPDFVRVLEVEDMDSGTATDGQVATANGSGDITWETPTTGGGGSFDLHDDVGTQLTNLNVVDRFVVADESVKPETRTDT